MAVLLGERLLPVRQIGIERSRFMGKRSINGRTKGALCLVLLILGCAVSGCRSGQVREPFPPSSEEPGTEPGVVDLNWYINYSWFATVWGDSEVARAITDATGVSVHYQTPKGDESEKMDAMIAADTLPDLVTLGWSEKQNYDMIEKGQVWALNELADQYDPAFYGSWMRMW